MSLYQVIYEAWYNHNLLLFSVWPCALGSHPLHEQPWSMTLINRYQQASPVPAVGQKNQLRQQVLQQLALLLRFLTLIFRTSLCPFFPADQCELTCSPSKVKLTSFSSAVRLKADGLPFPSVACMQNTPGYLAGNARPRFAPSFDAAANMSTLLCSAVDMAIVIRSWYSRIPNDIVMTSTFRSVTAW